jgi:ring-1,2-phenylacetyl-CoA epoxidase subunit PaaC
MAASIDDLLHLADNALVLGQRNAEWCGHGPVLEEDMAMANVSLDLIGQARLLYQHIATQLNQQPALARSTQALRGMDTPTTWTEDVLAYFRNGGGFRNYTLLELPHFPSHTGVLAGTTTAERDFATTIARNFLYSALMALLWEALAQSGDSELAAIAAKSAKENRYHLRHSREWLVRLGDGTDESHQRMQSALNHLMPYTQEFWSQAPAGSELARLCAGLQDRWNALVDDALQEATLQRPRAQGHVSQGKLGLHSEHLSYLLDEMQSLARQHPGASW